MYEPYKIRTPIRLIECFAGIGSQAKALERLGANFEHYRVVEFDKYAIASYNAIHGTKFETSDITKIHAWDLGIVDTDEFTYLLTYSFPCQDLSLAGKQRGMKKGSGTRSGLLWEVERLLDECDELPQILLMENVPEVIGSKNIEHFQKWAAKLESLGYKNYTQILNAKNYGIPQNRNRCFMVSILGDYYYEFPEPFELKLRLKDMLEDDVDEKYFLSQKGIDYFKKQAEKRGENLHQYDDRRLLTLAHGCSKGSNKNDEICPTLDTQFSNNWHGVLLEPKLIQVGSINLGNNESNNRVYAPEGLSPTLSTMQGGHRQPKIVEPLICASRGRNSEQKHTEQRIEINYSGCSNTLTTVQKDNYVIVPETTKKGYAEAYEGDGVYINRPHQKRGVVQNGMIQTLKTSGNDIGVVVGTYQYAKSDKFMNGKSRFNEGKDIADTIQTSPKEGVAIYKRKDIKHQDKYCAYCGKCIICGEPQKGLGYCNKHYIRFKKYGDSLFTKNKDRKDGDFMNNGEEKLRIRKLTPLE